MKKQNCFLRLTPENKKFITDKANAEGLSLNAWVNLKLNKERSKNEEKKAPKK